MERVRKLYQKFLEWAPENCAAWCKFAELERDLNEKARAQGYLTYPLPRHQGLKVRAGVRKPICQCDEVMIGWGAFECL